MVATPVPPKLLVKPAQTDTTPRCACQFEGSLPDENSPKPIAKRGAPPCRGGGGASGPGRAESLLLANCLYRQPPFLLLWYAYGLEPVPTL